MSIIFFGTPEFAVPSLRALIASGEEVRLVVTQPDRLKGRGHKLIPSPVKNTAAEAGIRVIQPQTIKEPSFAEEISSIRPEFIVVAAYGQVLPGPVLNIPQHGCINVHASLLPDYRGAAPIAWAIIRGEQKTGITTMLMDEGLDTGDILLQQELEIMDTDTAETLGRKLSVVGADLLFETIKRLRDGSVKPVPQTGASSYAPSLKKEDGLIDWSKKAVEVHNFVRGMQPWPGAYCHINNELVKLITTNPIDGEGIPGVITKASDNELTIGAGKGLLSIIELQPSAKKVMPAQAFLQGRSLKAGIALQ